MIIQGIWTSFAKKPYIFMIFQWGGGGGGQDLLSPLWIRACSLKYMSQSIKVTMLTGWCYSCQLQICNCIVGSTGGGGRGRAWKKQVAICTLRNTGTYSLAKQMEPSWPFASQGRCAIGHEGSICMNYTQMDRILLETVLRSCSNF